MSEAGEVQTGEMEVTPEERRFLERFFRRQMLPWFGALVVIAVTSAWALQPDDGGDREARVAASLAQMSTANERLRAELAALTERVEAGASRGSQSANELERSVEDARRNVRMIEGRITAALGRRLDALEARGETGAAAPAGSLEFPADTAAASWCLRATGPRRWRGWPMICGRSCMPMPASPPSTGG